MLAKALVYTLVLVQDPPVEVDDAPELPQFRAAPPPPPSVAEPSPSALPVHAPPPASEHELPPGMREQRASASSESIRDAPGWGSIGFSALFGAVNIGVLGLQIGYQINPIATIALPLNLSFAGTLTGAIGTRLLGEWQATHQPTTTGTLLRATRARSAGWSLLGAAPVLAIGSLVALGTMDHSACEGSSETSDPSANEPGNDSDEPVDVWGELSDLSLTRRPGCMQLRRIPTMTLAMLAVASLQISVPLLTYARAWKGRGRSLADASFGPLYLPGGFGVGMSGRF